MSGFVTGDAQADARARGGWFVGHFLPAGDPRLSRDVEVKWGLHPAGDRNRGGFVANRRRRSPTVPC